LHNRIRSTYFRLEFHTRPAEEEALSSISPKENHAAFIHRTYVGRLEMQQMHQTFCAQM
jgi:hypothetical protein